MSILARLRVRLTAETQDFQRGLESARKQTRSFERDLKRFRRSTLANVASIGALGVALKSSLDVANRYDNAQRQLAATAKLTGTNFGFLQQTSKQAQEQFKLSGISANAFTIELTKLAGKAGDVGKASAGLEAFLDIGAARGLSADQTLKAVQQSILGIDEGTDKLFSKNPSVLYAEYAASIGTTAGKLTDQQKAQALLNAAMEDGGKVRGEYQRWLGSSQGQQYLLSQGIEQTQAALGKALQPALVAVIPLISRMADYVQQSIMGWQMLGAKLAVVPPVLRMITATITGNRRAFAEAALDYKAASEASDEVVQSILSGREALSGAAPLNLGTGSGSEEESGRNSAVRFWSGLEDEWERLRHQVELRRAVALTEPERLELEERHALRLLDVEEQHARARHRLGELSADELANTLEQINARRTLAQAERAQMEGAYRHSERLTVQMERQDMLQSHRIDLERLAGRDAIARLGTEATAEQRLATRLATIQRVFETERAGIIENTRLTDAQRELELQRLELARQRAEVEARGTAAQERARAKGEKRRKASEAAQAAAERRGDLRDQAIGAAGGMIAGTLTGSAPSGSQIGSQLGTIAGQMIPIPGASILAPMVGGLLGGLFDGENKPERVINSLDAIASNTAETISAIEQQTDKLLNPQRALLNLPSNFNVPSYAPQFASGSGGGGNTTIRYGDTHVTLHVTAPAGQTPEEMERSVERAVAKAINQGRASTPRMVTRY